MKNNKKINDVKNKIKNGKKNYKNKNFHKDVFKEKKIKQNNNINVDNINKYEELQKSLKLKPEDLKKLLTLTNLLIKKDKELKLKEKELKLLNDNIKKYKIQNLNLQKKNDLLTINLKKYHEEKIFLNFKLKTFTTFWHKKSIHNLIDFLDKILLILDGLKKYNKNTVIITMLEDIINKFLQLEKIEIIYPKTNEVYDFKLHNIINTISDNTKQKNKILIKKFVNFGFIVKNKIIKKANIIV